MGLPALIAALKSQEDFLLSRLFGYVKESEYDRYTSTKEEEWRVTLREPARFLAQYLEQHDAPDAIHVDDDLAESPAAAFGTLEAQRHRARGVKFEMFLGLTKLVRQAFVDLVYATRMADAQTQLGLAITHRFFDKLELGFCSEWVRSENTALLDELRATNREMTNRKNRYLTLFTSMAEPAYVVDADLRFVEVNAAFARLFNLEPGSVIGRKCYEFLSTDLCNDCPMKVLYSLRSPGRIAPPVAAGGAAPAKGVPTPRSFTGIETSLIVGGERRTFLMSGATLDDISGKNVGGVVTLTDITDRERLAKGLSTLAQAQSVAQIGSWDYDVIVDQWTWSREMLRIFGRDETSKVLTWPELAVSVHPEDRPALDSAIQAALQDGKGYSLELRILQPGGHILWVWAKGQAHRDDAGRVIRLQSTVQDITEHRRAEETLRDSAEQYHAITHTSMDGFWVVDSTGHITDVNQAICRLLGYSRDELLTMAIPDIEAVESPESIERRIRAIIETGEGRFEGRHRRKDGTVIEVEVSSTFMRRTGRFIAFVRDISERKRAEEALRESAEQHHTITHTSMDGFWVVEADGRILDVNAAACDMLGYSRDELLAMSIWDLEAVHSREFTENHIRTLVEAGAGRFEVQHRRKDGGVINVEVSTTLVRQTGRFMTFTRDISERKRAEETLLTSENALKVAQRLAKVGSWEWVVATDTVTWSEELYRINGRDPALGAPSYQEMPGIYTPESFARLDAAVRRAVETGESYELELDMAHPNGTTTATFTRGEAVRDATGQVVKLRGTVHDISERKRVEEALRASEERFQAIIDNTPSLVYLKDREGRFLLVNRRFAELFGDSPEALLGKTSHDVVRRDLADAHRANDLQVMASGIPLTIEELNEEADGFHTYLTVKFPLWDAAGGVSAVCGISTDITERKRAELALQEATDRLQLATTSGHIGVWEWDIQKNAAIWNDRMFELYGVPRDTSPVGFAVWQARLHPEDRASILETLQAGIRREKALDTEFRIVRPDGAIRFIRAHAVVIRGVDGQASRMIGMDRDITERKTREEELRLLSEIVTHTSEGVNLVRLEDRTIVYTNPRFEEMFGYGPGELIGQPVTILHPPGDKERSEAAETVIFDALERDGLWRGEIENIRKDGTRFWSQASVSEFRHPSHGKVGVSIHIDISDRKKLEQQFLQAQKMEAVGRLAGGIAHDFNNVLSVILGYAEFAMKAVREGDPLWKDIQEIRRAGERAAALTRQLLAFSRRQVLKPEALDLNSVVGEIESMVRRLIGEDIELVEVLAAELGQVKADRGQIEQVIVNLAVNARDAMADGGKLTIETDNVEIDQGNAGRHVGMKPGPYVMLSVSDTGCGMDEATRARIFEPFFTTKEMGKGTGLGLATVYGIVTQSGGDIWFYSELGKGTTFKIFLPRESEAVTFESQPARAATGAGRGETILVVEDEEAVRNLAKRILSAAGYRVLTAANGGEALLTCEQYAGAMHLLLTDVVMPQMNGRFLAERLATIRPGIKVLYMSGYTENAIVFHGVLDQGTHFISKPFNAPDLTRKVREILDKEVQRSHGLEA